MKIAIVGTRGALERYSGIEASVKETARLLGAKGYKLVIYCRKAKNKIGPRYLCQNVKLVYIPTVDSKHFGTLIHVIFSTVHLIFTDTDIVHFHALGPSLFSFLLRLFGKKTIVTIHGLDWKRKKWGLFARIFLKFCEYPAVFFPNKTIIVSQALKEYFEQKFRKKLYFIPNGINVDEISLKENADVKNAEYILFVGRLVPEKGIHYLIKAFNELRTAKKLIIVGRPSFTDTYEEYLRSLARENTEFLGFIQTEDLEKLYRRAYVFVLPSEVEGSSVSLLEAMGYGRCVLVSDIPESLEVVGDCGLSFKSTDYLDLKDKLQYLIDNPGVVSEIGLRAQKRAAEKYNWDSIINELEKLYLSLK